jgi:hypothetical protein
VVGCAALLGGNVLIDDAATLRTVGHRRVHPSMVEVSAAGGPPESCHLHTAFLTALAAGRSGEAPSRGTTVRIRIVSAQVSGQMDSHGLGLALRDSASCCPSRNSAQKRARASRSRPSS